jgi:hypothetical protein
VAGASKLIVIGTNGQQILAIPKEEDWFMIAGWLNNENLLLSPRPMNTDPVSLVELNLSTKERKMLLSNYPKILSLVQPYLFWEGYTHSETVYNSFLSRVVYPRNEEGIEAVVLWDIENEKEISHLPGITSYSHTPKWSPDGNSFVINSTLTILDPRKKHPNPERIGTDQELFRISRDGKIEQLSYFTSLYDKVNIGYYNWSPDGRYIAFWVQVEPDEYRDLYPNLGEYPMERLAVLDVETREIINYCIPGNAHLAWSSAPIWSPESNQILVEGYYKGDYKKGNTNEITDRVIIIDIDLEFAAQITENQTPRGWMIIPDQ